MSTQTLRTPSGTMAYTDVGTGPPIVFLHGNPTSAHLYRHLIKALAPAYRCIAPDYLGFDRSEAPASFSYRPPAHAALVESLLCRLDLSPLTLVLHDWGGPIGLSYALRHPDAIQRLVLMNTWSWPLTDRPQVQIFSRLIDTPLGQMAVERLNAFVHGVIPFTLGRQSPRRPPWLQTYADILDTRPRRRACWMLARSLHRETAWLRTLWTHRNQLREHPTLLCWGMDDPAFGTETTLRRWTTLFSNATVHRRSGIGHYVPEEMGTELVSLVTSFLNSTPPDEPSHLVPNPHDE